jgi:hypothetical protein
LTYPCQGVTGALNFPGAEEPNPFPGRNYASNPIGIPIYVQVPSGVIDIASATVRKVGGGVVPIIVQTAKISNQPGYIRDNEALLITDAKLDANAVYEVAINGSFSGTSFSKAFTFITGKN